MADGSSSAGAPIEVPRSPLAASLALVDVGLVDDAVAAHEGGGDALLLELGGELGRRRVLAAVEDQVGVEGQDVGDVARVVGDVLGDDLHVAQHGAAVLGEPGLERLGQPLAVGLAVVDDDHRLGVRRRRR